MSQHDYVIDNGSGAVVRADINSLAGAIVTLNSGGTAPSTTFAYMLWADTGGNALKMRNGTNTAWITIGSINGDDTLSISAVDVDITDSGGFYTATEVEAALQEAAQFTQGQHTIWLLAGALVPNETNGPAAGSLETTTNAVMAETLDFDPTTGESAQIAIQMPKSWDGGTIVAQFIWSHPATATNFGVTWGIQAVAFADDDALDTAFGTAQTVSDTGGTTDDIYISPETSAMTVAGSPGAEELVVFRIYRDPSDGSDDLAVDARLHGVKLHYTTDANTDS